VDSGLELIPRSISDLSRARRAAGVTLEEVAVRSRVPEPLLRELELGDLRNWPTGLYARTEIVRYARAAGLDERDVLGVVTPLLEQRVGPPDLDATQLFPAEDDVEEPFPAEEQLWSAPAADSNARIAQRAMSPVARSGSLIFEPIPATWPIPEPPSRVEEVAPQSEELRPAERHLLRTAPVVPPRHKRRYAGTVAAACVAVALVGAVGWRALTRGANDIETVSTDAPPAAAAQPVQADPAPAPQPVSEVDAPEPTPTANLDTPQSPPVIGATNPPTAEARTTENVDRPIQTSGRVSQPSAPSTPPSVVSPSPVAPTMEPASPLRGGALEAMSLPKVDVTAPPPAPGPPPAPAPRTENNEAAAAPRRAEAAPAIDQRTAVRLALQRYEAAYSDLDAAAARAVWPAVNERALARAFDGLASQSVSLGQCDVVVNGATARATCSGRAAWTPKVGGGERTASRRWAFELRNTDGGWEIVRADAR
jgi:cytoskeletal protein RodZ